MPGMKPRFALSFTTSSDSDMNALRVLFQAALPFPAGRVRGLVAFNLGLSLQISFPALELAGKCRCELALARPQEFNTSGFI